MRTNHILAMSLAVICSVAVSNTAFADLGNFNITKDCPATKSLHANDNPGHIKVKSGETYPAVQLNKQDGSYMLIRIPNAKPATRWVEITCGTLSDKPNNPDDNQTGGDPNASSKQGEFLLAASWQPAFCESSAGANKEECETETEQRFDATHFTLHGLWPQPKGNYYCKVSKQDSQNDAKHKWDKLPEPILTAETRKILDEVMPGTASNLQRHEWIKHGTCFGTGPESYFRTAIALMNQLNNNSELQKLVQGNIGKEVTAVDLANAFEKDFGAGSAKAMVVECSKDEDRVLISGFSVNLQGVLNPSTKLQDVLDTSKKSTPSKCAKGIIDKVGKD
jgi:ribonuclease T2